MSRIVEVLPVLERDLQHWIDQGFTIVRTYLGEYVIDVKPSVAEPIYLVERKVSDEG